MILEYLNDNAHTFNSMLRIGDDTPDFTPKTTKGNIY